MHVYDNVQMLHLHHSFVKVSVQAQNLITNLFCDVVKIHIQKTMS